jgi:hypothetical protein
MQKICVATALHSAKKEASSPAMQLVRFGKVIALSVLFSLSGIGGSVLHAETALTADAVIQKAVARAQQDESRGTQPAFDYSKVTVTEELDSSGKVKERKERVYEVSFRDGQSHVRILSVNGRAPDGAELRKQSENQTNFRQAFSNSKSAKRDRENFLTPELAARFQFRFIDRRTFNGRASYQIGFEPRSPRLPENKIVERVLNRLSGTLWIDAEEFEVARAEIFLRSEVNLLGGVIGSLKKLAYTLDRTRVDEGLWFSTSSTGDFEARKLLDSTHIKTKSSSKNFRRVASETSRDLPG